MTDWIPVGERLPEENSKVIIYSKVLFFDVEVDCGILFDGEWQTITNGGWDSCEPTHWMPLPEAPKDSE